MFYRRLLVAKPHWSVRKPSVYFTLSMEYALFGSDSKTGYKQKLKPSFLNYLPYITKTIILIMPSFVESDLRAYPILLLPHLTLIIPFILALIGCSQKEKTF